MSMEPASGTSRQTKATAVPASAASLPAFSVSTLALVQYTRVGQIPSTGSGLTRTSHAASLEAVSGAHRPSLISLRTVVRAASPRWRMVSLRTAVPRPSSPAFRQAAVSKQKLVSLTGGSCKKSPTTSTWIPPKGFEGTRRTARAMASRAWAG